MDNVWIVTYRDAENDPVVTVFDNESAAQRCYKIYDKIHLHAWIDKVEVNHSFKMA